MSDYDRWRRLRHAAMAVRVGAFVLLAFLPALASIVSGLVGDAQAQQQPAGKVYRIGFLSQGRYPRPISRRFSRVCENEDTPKVETSSGSCGRPTAAWTNFRNSPRSWCD